MSAVPLPSPPDLLRALSDEGRSLLNTALEEEAPAAGTEDALFVSLGEELEEVADMYGSASVTRPDGGSVSITVATDTGVAATLEATVPPTYPVAPPDVLVMSDALPPGALATIQTAVDQQIVDVPGTPCLLSLCLTVEQLLRESGASAPRASPRRSPSPPPPPAELPSVATLGRGRSQPRAGAGAAAAYGLDAAAVADSRFDHGVPTGAWAGGADTGSAGVGAGAGSGAAGAGAGVSRSGGGPEPEHRPHRTDTSKSSSRRVVQGSKLVLRGGPPPMHGSVAFALRGMLWIHGGDITRDAVVERTLGAILKHPGRLPSAVAARQLREFINREGLNEAALRTAFRGIPHTQAERWTETIRRAVRSPSPPADAFRLWCFKPVTREWCSFALPEQLQAAPPTQSATAIGGNRALCFGCKPHVYIVDVSNPSKPSFQFKHTRTGYHPAPGHTAVRRPGTHSHLIVFGGLSKWDNLDPGAVRLYDAAPALGSWETIATSGAHPGACQQHEATTVRQFMLIAGGVQRGTRTSNVFALDTDSWTWHAVRTTGMKPPARCQHVFESLGNDSFVVFGGLGWGQRAFDDLWVGSLQPEFNVDGDVTALTAHYESFDLTHRGKERVTRLVEPRAAACGVVIGTRLLVFGGYTFCGRAHKGRGFNDGSALGGDTNSLLAFTVKPEDVRVPATRYHADFSRLFDFAVLDGSAAANLTVTTGGDAMTLHKAIVALRCPGVTSAVIAADTLDLSSYHHEAVQAVMQYVYTCRCTVPAHRVAEAMSLLRHLGMTHAGGLYDRLKFAGGGTSVTMEVPPGAVSRQFTSDLTAGVPCLHPTLVRALPSGDDPEALCDFAIVADGEAFAVHQCVLIARSEVFATMLSSDMAEVSRGSVDVEFSADTVSAFVEYMYTDRCTRMDVDNVPELLTLAATHMLPRLASLCERFMVASFDLTDPESALGVASFARDLGAAARRVYTAAMYSLVCNTPKKLALATLDSMRELLDSRFAQAAEAAIRTGDWDK